MANRTNVNTDLANAASSPSGDMSAESFEQFLINLNKKEKAQLASDERLAAAKKVYEEEILKKKIAAIEASGATEEIVAAKIAKLKANSQNDIVALAQQMEENIYKFSSAKQKALIKQQQIDTIKNGKEAIKQQMAEIAISKIHGNSKNAQLKKLRQEQLKAGQEAVALEEQKRKLGAAAIAQKRKDGVATRDEIDAQLDAINESFQAQREQHAENIDNLNEQIKLLEEKKKKGKLKDGGTIDKEIEDLKGKRDEEKQAVKDTNKQQLKEGTLANAMKGVTHALNEGLSQLGDQIGSAINNAVETVGQHRSGIEARLQGSMSSYDKAAGVLKDALAVSPFVKQKDVLQKLSDAVDKGIAYNVEQRAFLATMTDKIVSTFDAFDSNLMRIIRLQQADTTAARMGMEANLLQFFNSTYSDSSYLTDGYDQVAAALVDANAQMARDMSIAFEYNVQKWMGSLASLGFGTDTLQTIATGINYLGSGNVQALSGNTQLQNLLAMSASRAGLSYSDMLVEGINDSQVNTLLKAMVEYLREIATDNNAVVKAAYGDIFNFSQADLRAVANLNDSDINNISSQTMTYSNAMSEIQSQLNQIGDRLSTSEMIDNIFDNFLYTSGETIANNVGTAITWRLLNTIESFTGGIHLPAISVMGNMVDLSTFTIEGIAKTGLFGLSALANLGNMVSSIANGGGMDLSIWGGTEYTSRGGNFEPNTKGAQTSTSGSKSKASASSSDMKKASLSETEEDQETMKKSSEESMGDQKTIDDLYKATVLNDEQFKVIDPFTYPLINNINKNVGTITTTILPAHTAYLNNINKNVSTITATILPEHTTHLNNIYDKLSGTLNVSISGLDAMFTKNAPKEVQKVKLVDNVGEKGTYIDLPKLFTELATNFKAALSGEEIVPSTSDDTYTLSRFIKWIMEQEGSIKVTEPNMATIKDKVIQIEKDIQ